jgi:NitT/TauT family transport system substrate-binding protein
VEKAAQQGDDVIKPVWDILVKQINAFPGAMDTFTVQNFKDLIPVYKAAEALEGKVDVEKIIDRTYLDQALKELN